jgi:hypothetical protein
MIASAHTMAERKPYGRIAEEINVGYKTVVNVSSQLKQNLDDPHGRAVAASRADCQNFPAGFGKASLTPRPRSCHNPPRLAGVGGGNA